MRLTLLRHGETEANRSHRFNGTLDDPLLEAQRRDLERVAFDSSGYDAIYCSPLVRAVETADQLGIRDWIPEPGLAERHLGIFQGLTANECLERYPDEYRAFAKFDADYRIPGGESRAENLARVLSWLSDASRHRHVLAVTHGGTVDFLYRIGSGRPAHGGEEIFGSENASLSTFEVDWPEVRLLEYSSPLTPSP